MTPGEQLECLIERWERGSWLRPVANDEIEACFAAAEVLMQFQAMTVSSAFAARLEALVRAHVRSLAAQQNKVIAFPGAQAQTQRRQRTRNNH